MVEKCTLLLTFLFSLSASSQNFELPKNCTIFQTAKGDLDKDGEEETVFVCNMDQSSLDSKDNFKRKLFIVKDDEKGAVLLKENATILKDSKDCGFCFDEEETPLVGLEIKNNTLIIIQEFYNNRRRTERNKLIFRFQNNDWFLIGSTYRFWDTCDFDHRCDINFSTNQVIITDIDGDCDEVDFNNRGTSIKKFKYPFKKVTMDTYKPTEIKFKEKVFFIY